MDFTSNIIGLLGQPAVKANQFDQLGRALGQGISGYQKQQATQQATQQAAQQKDADRLEALYTSKLLNTQDMNQRVAIMQDGYSQGIFDDEDMELFATSRPDELDSVLVDVLKADGYESLLPDSYRGDSSRFGRAIAGVDAEGNEVFFQTDSQGNTRVVDGITPQSIANKEEQKTEALVKREKALETQQNKIKQQQIDLVKKQLDLTQNQRMQGAKDREVQSQIDLGNTILNADLSKIFGRGEEFYPDLLRSQDGIDLKANVNQFVGQLKLAAAGKMKGQGSVSDSERKTLNEAATVLSNPNISADLARKSMQDAVDAINATMTQGGGSTPAQAQPAAQDQATAGQNLTPEQLLIQYKAQRNGQSQPVTNRRGR